MANIDFDARRGQKLDADAVAQLLLQGSRARCSGCRSFYAEIDLQIVECNDGKARELCGRCAARGLTW